MGGAADNAGMGLSELTAFTAEHGALQAQGYKLVKRAWAQIKYDINETGIDRQELLSWSIQTLMAAAGQAMQQKNPAQW